MRHGVLFSRLPATDRASHPRDACALLYLAGWVALACAAGACGGSTVATSAGPSPVKCSITLTPPASPVNESGAIATLGVAAQPECAWSALSEAGWITGLAPTSGQGSAQLQFQVAANPDASARHGDIVVNGVRGRITQDAASCRFELSSTRQAVPSSGGTGSITVSATAACAWSARSDETWIAITAGATGTGPGTVSFTAAPNSGSPRSASLVIAGQSVTISQGAVPSPAANCGNLTVSPRTISVSPAATNGLSTSITAPSGCEWSASSNASWISLTGRTSGSGSGTLTFNVSSNGGASRTGTLTVAGQIVTITQGLNSASCSYLVNPTSVSMGSGGGAAGPFTVATMDDCAWSATSNASWLSITSSASGTGDGIVAVSVAANTGDVRSATLTIGNRTVTVTQAAAPCSYSVAPASVSIGAVGGTGPPVSVTTFSACAWTATSNTNWLTIVNGASGTGNGTVSYSILPNTGAVRTGTFTVAGRTVTISQRAPCTYTISPTSQSVARSSGTGGPISVTTQVGCTWTAVSKVSWITVTSGASGTGNGTVTFSVTANDTGGTRKGEIAIAGSTFTVAQQQ